MYACKVNKTSNVYRDYQSFTEKKGLVAVTRSWIIIERRLREPNFRLRQRNLILCEQRFSLSFDIPLLKFNAHICKKYFKENDSNNQKWSVGMKFS